MNPVEGHEEAESRGKMLAEEGVRRKAGCETVAPRRVPDHLIEVGEVES